jgi:DNA-binding NarL/FixJ family response regulator
MSATHNASTLSAVENACPTVGPLRRIRVLLADNSPDFQTVVGALLEIEDSVEVVGRVGGANEIIEASAALKPDLLLIELGPVKFVGLTTAALVSWTFPQLNIVLMGDYDSPRLRAKSRTSGARFFIYKPNFNLEFAQVLQTVSSLPNGYNVAEKAEGLSAAV